MTALFLHTYYSSNSDINEKIDRQVEMNRNDFNSILIGVPFVIALTFFSPTKNEKSEILSFKGEPLNCMAAQKYRNLVVFKPQKVQNFENFFLENISNKSSIENVLGIRGGDVVTDFFTFLCFIVCFMVLEISNTDAFEIAPPQPFHNKQANQDREYLGKGVSMKRRNYRSIQRNSITSSKFAEKQAENLLETYPTRSYQETVEIIKNLSKNQTLIEDNLFLSNERIFAKSTHARQWNVTDPYETMSKDDIVFLQQKGHYNYIRSGRPMATQNKIDLIEEKLKSFIFDSKIVKLENSTHTDHRGPKPAVVYFEKSSGQFVCFDKVLGGLITFGKLKGTSLTDFKQNGNIGMEHKIIQEIVVIPTSNSVSVSENNLTTLSNLTDNLTFSNEVNFTPNEMGIRKIQNLDEFR
jgi:hypothetical protein